MISRIAVVQKKIFFPAVGENPYAARRVCTACPVRTACLFDALERGDVVYGVLGGKTPTERQAMLREQNTDEPDQIGWVA